MIEKIKNFMSNSNTTDLVSYSDEDDYSNFWKDLKPIKYESPIEILRNHANNFNTNSSLGPKYHLNIEIDKKDNVFMTGPAVTVFTCDYKED